MGASAGKNFRSSPTVGSADKMPIVEMGIVASVDSANYLVDVLCEASGRVHKEIQVSMPYFNPNNGEGIFVMPEVGARVVVMTMSDDNPPIVLAFGAVIEDMFVDEPNDPDNTQELEDEGLTTAPDVPDEEGQPAFSYRNGRPLLRPGDFCMRTRDGNFIYLRRGGVVQIGSNATTQTIFMPIRNLIRTFAENYEMELLGGSARWEIVQEEDDSSSAINTFLWREYAEQADVSAMMRIGDLDENFLRFAMVMEGIDAKTLEAKESPVIELTFSKEGDIVLACKSYTQTVEEDRTIEVGGKEIETFGSLEREVEGNQKLTFDTETREGTSSKEKLKSKLIEADSITLGSAAGAQPLLKGNATLTWLASHTHPVSGGATLAPATPPPLSLLSTKSKTS